MRKKIVTLFLLLVLSIQMLPVQQMGNALFSNQFTEEIPHSLDTDRDLSKKSNGQNDYVTPGVLAINTVSTYLSFQHHYIADNIPQNFTGEVDVPPPNC